MIRVPLFVGVPSTEKCTFVVEFVELRVKASARYFCFHQDEWWVSRRSPGPRAHGLFHGFGLRIICGLFSGFVSNDEADSWNDGVH
jgi:hypothetical protein